MKGETMKGDYSIRKLSDILDSLERALERASTLSRDNETVVNAIETARKETLKALYNAVLAQRDVKSAL